MLASEKAWGKSAFERLKERCADVTLLNVPFRTHTPIYGMTFFYDDWVVSIPRTSGIVDLLFVHQSCKLTVFLFVVWYLLYHLFGFA